MSTTVASLGAGTGTSLIKLDAVKPKPATDRGLALPSAALIDDGSGPRVRNLVLELPDLDLGEVAVASRLGDQPLPAVFRAAPLAGPALASPMRGMAFTTTGTAPLSLSFGQMGTVPATGTPAPGSPALAAAAVSFTPNTRLSVTPQMVIPVGSPGAQTSVGTAIQANVVSNLALLTDVGVAGNRRHGLGAAGVRPSRRPVAPRRHRNKRAARRGRDRAPRRTRRRSCRHATARPRRHRCSRCQALRLRHSRARRAPRPTRMPTTRHWVRSASPTTASRPGNWPRFGSARRRPRGSRKPPRSNGASVGWAAWPCATCSDGRPIRRWTAVDEASSRVEVDLPTLAPHCAGRLDLRAALTAGSSSLTGPGVNSRVSGRVGLIDDAALTGETELGITGGDGQVLRALRVTTDMPVVPATRLQLSYSYRVGAQFPLGQVLEARILRRFNLGW